MTVKRIQDAGENPLVERVRAACIEAALQGYEHAAMSGLCGEGALEATISAIRMLDLTAISNVAPGQGDS